MASFLELSEGQLFAERYRVTQLLARGRLGAVYAVSELSTGRLRALKLLLPSAGSDSASCAFEEEARTGALIQSEHVVDVLAAGREGAERVPWLVMELLEGDVLDEYLEEFGALDANQTYAIAAQLFHALSAAHDLGIVHRALKPENLFLARSNEPGRDFNLKVLGFGLALRVLPDAKELRARVDLSWAAPEQLQPYAAISPSADIWAVGLVLFRMLSGHGYFRATDSEASSLQHEILEARLPPASERAREAGGAPLPPGFDAWFARCVARSPADRFAHAREAWQGLHTVLVEAGATPLSPRSLRQRPRTDPAPRLIPLIEPSNGPDSSGKTLISRSDPDLRRSSNPELKPGLVEVRVSPKPELGPTPRGSSSPELRGSRPSLPGPERAAGRASLFFLLLILALGAAGALWLKSGKHAAIRAAGGAPAPSFERR